MKSNSRYRSTIDTAYHYSYLILILAGTISTAAHAQSAEHGSTRGFTPAHVTETETSVPALQFGQLEGKELVQARQELAKYDLQLSEAFRKADETFARMGNPHARPVLPELDKSGLKTDDISDWVSHDLSQDVVPKKDKQYTALDDFKAIKVSSNSARSGCSGNCYQTDRLNLTDPGDDMYASEYWVWLAVPAENELNACDGPPHGSGCFWFYAINHSTNAYNTGFHIGPQRGASLAGNAGANWRMNIDGYINGAHVGGQSSVNLPVATWIRVRTWRINSGRDAQAPYTPWATWGVWAMYNGNDHYLGSLTIDGNYMTNATLFSEIWEQDGQCVTDLERGYLGWPRYWRPGLTQRSFSSATANYEANCQNTSWEIVGNEFVRDERNTNRTLQNGESVW